MKALSVAAIAVAVLAAPVTASAQGSAAQRTGFSGMAEKLVPSVVNIAAEKKVESRGEGSLRDFFEERFGGEGGGRSMPAPRSLGSGFVIGESGYIVTNHHVVAKADTVNVRFSDGRELEAEVVGQDRKTDLALLKVDADRALPAVEWGDSEAAQIGDWVLAIGNPFGLGGSVTAGIVSGRGRDLNAGPYDNFIQTDAAINRGNSGGPLFNAEGEVIGVNTAIFSPNGGSVGVGFAVPASMAQRVVAELREGGRVKRAWLGVRIQKVTPELASALGMAEARGALVASVADGSPAQRAGVQPRDVIVRFNGEPVPEMRMLPRMVAQMPVGEEVTVTVVRDGEQQQLRTDLARLSDDKVAKFTGQREPAQPEKPQRVTVSGLALAPLTDATRREFDLGEPGTGAVVIGVEGDSPAAAADVRPGDVVVEVNQRETESPAAVRDALRTAREQGDEVATLLVVRRGDYRWIAVPFE
ncbi:Do family serine endopeptidase [Limimonas halophila]|uniref:Do family serine endopeptidase n=1 Tax=Limimonas halophila TaxID=1082479 RepID=UPI001FE16BF8|nr:Do family serine endopeptidase [Limimonas halophila]